MDQVIVKLPVVEVRVVFGGVGRGGESMEITISSASAVCPVPLRFFLGSTKIVKDPEVVGIPFICPN